MQTNELTQLLLYFGALIGLTPVLGRFMARVFERQKSGRLEALVYRLSRVDANEEMSWKRYFFAVVIFNVVGILSLMAVEMTQASLPCNPQKFPNIPWALALNTAVSFITNTNWQAYSGENTMSYFTQMAGLTVHNFLSAATGIAILVALARGLKRASAKTLGSFWVDPTRATLYVLLPFAAAVAILLASQGVIQNLSAYRTVKTIEGAEQVIPGGP